ncbi:MAG: radical SAM protein [Desulfuromonadaceae bacterium]
MSTACQSSKAIHGHPCFGGDHKKNGRIHLPVAPRCNIKCNYCTRRHDCANESRPGVTSRILTPFQALERVREVKGSPVMGPIIKVVGIAGPGDPLANEETFETFELIHAEFPEMIKCLSTNGLMLPQSMERLEWLDLRSLTITINAISPQVGSRIYSYVQYQDQTLRGVEAAELLIRNQLDGLQQAADRGITVKINTVLIPGINDFEVEKIAVAVKSRGAAIMNVMPLIPQADFAHVKPPTDAELSAVRDANQHILGQFKHCSQCRADAVGLIGQNSLHQSLV